MEVLTGQCMEASWKLQAQRAPCRVGMGESGGDVQLSLSTVAAVRAPAHVPLFERTSRLTRRRKAAERQIRWRMHAA